MENIPALIKKLKGINNKSVEIILVNNGSTDNSKEVLQKNINFQIPKIRLINLKKNIGYGHGIMAGVKKATGDFIAWTHADLQTDPIDVIGAFKQYTRNRDYKNSIIKGKRVGRNFFDFFFKFLVNV